MSRRAWNWKHCLGLDKHDIECSILWKYELTSANTQLIFSPACATTLRLSDNPFTGGGKRGGCLWQRKAHFLYRSSVHFRWARHLICLNTSWSMSAFNLKHNHFWLNWAYISTGTGINFFFSFFFFTFVHPFIIKEHKKLTPSYSLKRGNTTRAQRTVSPYFKGPDLAKVQGVVKNSFYKIMLPSVFQKCNPIASHQPAGQFP